MLIGVITDIHSNYAAAIAAVTALRDAGADIVVHTGDAISIGPQPVETLDYLIGQEVVLILGNHELSVRNEMWTDAPDWMGPGERLHEEWVSRQLTQSHTDAIDRMPLSVTYTRGNHTVLFQHYLYDTAMGFFGPFSGFEKWRESIVLRPEPPSMVVFGHDHKVRDELISATRFVSPGPAGCTRTDAVPAGLITLTSGALEYRQLSIPYDRSATLRELEARKVPDREEVRRLFFGA